MTMQTVNRDEIDLSRIEQEEHKVELSSVAVLAKSEVEAQLDAAHRHTRSVRKFINEAMTLATLSPAIAESCIYAIPRDGKVLAGPSVRLAEIVASAYGNLHIASRIVDTDETHITAQGVAWDLEKNLRVSVEVRRKITGKNGRRFSDDMITVTGAAAASIALRNAIFRVVPRAYVDTVYAKARQVAAGDAKSLDARRRELVERLAKMGVPHDRILPRVGKPSLEDVGLDEVEMLIGLGTAIKEGSISIDEAFPAITAAPSPTAGAKEGERVQLRPRRTAHDPKTGEIGPTPEEEAKRRDDAAAEVAMANRQPGDD
jgi:hypothetical protein